MNVIMRTGKVHVKCSKEDLNDLHSPLCTGEGISEPEWSSKDDYVFFSRAEDGTQG